MESHKFNAQRQRFNTLSSACQTVVLLGALVLTCLEPAQPQVPVPGPTEDIARLRIEVQEGQADAIAKAGDTYNPIFIDDLRALQTSPSMKEGDIPRLIRVSLAKLGDKDALQESYCRVQSQYPLVKQNAIENDLPKIGGWFSIWALERQFEEDERWTKAPRKYWKSVAPDVVLVPPSNLALMVLPKLVKDPPLPSPPSVIAQMSAQRDQVAVWKAWINTNSTSLRTLRPGGLDVNTSATGCSTYRNKEKQWLAEITH